MQALPLDQVQPGMRLARAVFSPDSALYLNAGVSLQASYIRRLAEMGFQSIFVTDGTVEGIELPEPVAVETRRLAISSVQDSMIRVSAGRPLDSRLVREAVDLLVQDVLGAPEVVIALIDLKAIADHTFSHSAGVAALCVMVGKYLDLPRSDLIELGTGGLLHDIGKAYIPVELLMRPGKLSAEEFEMIKRHPTDGFNLLRRAFPVSIRAAHMAYQHHERLDGSGYPRGLRGDEIHVFGRICGACDTFDAMCSDRAYASAVHPLEAIVYLLENKDRLYDAQVAGAIGKIVAPFPVASLVLLSTGEIAVVKSLRAGEADRPLVQLVRDSAGQPLQEADRIEIDLRERADVRIVRPVFWHELNRVDPPRAFRQNAR